MVTAKDIEYLIRRLFGDDNHDYMHERARVQIGSSLSLFAGSGACTGAIIEPSSCHAAQIVVNELIFKLLCGYRRENQA